jgi:hypothetical protein
MIILRSPEPGERYERDNEAAFRVAVEQAFAQAPHSLQGFARLLAPNTFLHPQKGPFQDRGGAVYNVKAYGAVGDGTTDDTVSIQAAWDASGGTIYFPRGQYLVSSNVVDGATVLITAGTTLDYAGGGGFFTATGAGSVNGTHHRVINSAGAGLVYGHFMVTDSDVVDTAAALAIRNIGHSDSVYLEVSGRTGEASVPTGIGIDLNKAAGASGESDPLSAGFGIQVYDHSITDQGVDGPHMIYLLKTGNPNSQHPALEIVSNQHAVRLIDNPADAGYNGAAALMSHWRADTGANRWRWNADGNLLFVESPKGILFDFESGQQGALKWDKAGLTVDMVGGTNGLRVLNNAGAAVNAQFYDDGTFVPRGSVVFTADAKGVRFPFPVGALGGMKVDQSGGWVDLIGGSAGGVRVLNNGLSVINAQFYENGDFKFAGDLVGGTVPAERVSAGTFGAGNYEFSGEVAFDGTTSGGFRTLATLRTGGSVRGRIGVEANAYAAIRGVSGVDLGLVDGTLVARLTDRLLIGTTANGDTAAGGIRATGKSQFDGQVVTLGSVGVNHLTPSRTVHVRGTDGASAIFSMERTGSNPSAILLTAEIGATSIYSRAGDASSTGVPLLFRIGATERMRLDGSHLTVVLPTTNPGGSGRLWNDGGTVKIT